MRATPVGLNRGPHPGHAAQLLRRGRVSANGLPAPSSMSPLPAEKMAAVTASHPQTAGQWVRLIGNLVNLSTPLGLLVALVGRAEIHRGPRGLFLAEHYRLTFPVAGAFTIGNVITTGTDW